MGNLEVFFEFFLVVIKALVEEFRSVDLWLTQNISRSEGQSTPLWNQWREKHPLKECS
jgi:hypothetical protein